MMRPLVAVLLGASLLAVVYGHGRMFWPISRSSMWRFGYDVPINWDDDELNCGGYDRQHIDNGGNCGICGDDYSGTRHNEAGGMYASGIISGNFQPGQVVDFFLAITSNHYGWSEFRICPNNDVNTPATQECLDQYVLEMADGSGTRWYLPRDEYHANFTVPVRLPTDLTCDQCVVQWRWICGNRWDCSADCEDPDVENCGMGCGPQETFGGCADISINW